MLDELRTMDWVPRLVRSKASKLAEATKTLEARLGRHPTERELAEHMELSVEELEKMMLEAYQSFPTHYKDQWAQLFQFTVSG